MTAAAGSTRGSLSTRMIATMIGDYPGVAFPCDSDVITSRPNRIAAEAAPRVRRSSHAIAEGFAPAPQPS